MVRGRKPKPTILKELAGNPGRRPLPENEPKAAPKLPPPPEWLTGEARAEYDRLGVQLEELGVITDLDLGALASYCVAWDRFCSAEKMIAKMGTFVAEDGKMRANPACILSRQMMHEMRKYASELGLTPVSRPRIHANPAKKAAKGGSEAFFKIGLAG